MSDLERAFLEHLGDQFTPYVGREEGMPLPEQLRERARAEKERQRELRRQQRIANERAALSKLKNNEQEFERVARAVCAVHGVEFVQLTQQNKTPALFAARCHLMWLARHRLEMGWTEIGRALKRDHASVINACEQFEGKFATMPQICEVEKLLAEVTQPFE